MSEEMYDFFDKVAQATIPKITRDRQSLPPWITQSTTNLMEKLNTQRKLVAKKPTSYRKNIVRKNQNVVTEVAEIDWCNYQEKIMSTRDTSVIFKHLKNFNNSPNLPKVLIDGGRSASNIEDKVNLLNNFLHSFYTPEHSFSIEDINSMNPTLTNFGISKPKINRIQSELDITKTRGSNGYPPIFRKPAKPMTDILYLVFKNIKRWRKIPDKRKIASVTPIYKKSDRRLVTNYLPISILNIDSNIFEKCMYEPLYEHFEKHFSKHQHGFAQGRSVTTNMFSFLQKLYEAMDKNTSYNIVTFYSDFSKAFDKVPHKELLIEIGQIGVGGCFREVLVDYRHNRRQFVRSDNTRSRIIEITSGVPQGSLLGPFLFCIIINDLKDVLTFSDPYLFADDLKILSLGYSDTEIQEDINAVQNWVATNKMELAVDKCAILNIRGPEKDFELLTQNLNSLQAVKDLGINVSRN